jgi:hypothetical protein
MSNVCLICKESFTSEKNLHLHISKKEKTKIEDYYKRYFPRYDLYDNTIIKFKNKEQYFSDRFNNKENFEKWFKICNSTDLKKQVVKEILENKCKIKQYKYSLSQSELRSTSLPSVITIDNLFSDVGGYSKLCLDIGLINKFNYSDINIQPMNDKLSICIDTREQEAFSFNCESRLIQLTCGDYTAEEPYYDDVYIERKSLQDFLGTFGSPNGFSRFIKEIERAESFGFYILKT